MLKKTKKNPKFLQKCSGKRNSSHLRVRRHVVPDLRPLASDGIDQPLGEPGLREALDHVQGRDRPLRRRLEHDRVASD